MPEVAEIRVPGLSRAEVLELQELLDPGLVRMEERPVPEGTFGELALATAVVICAPYVLKALISFLAYRYSGTSVTREIELVRPDGTRIHEKVSFRQVGVQANEVALARTLGDLTGIDPKSLIDEVGS